MVRPGRISSSPRRSRLRSYPGGWPAGSTGTTGDGRRPADRAVRIEVAGGDDELSSRPGDACVRGRLRRQDGGRSGDRRQCRLARSGPTADPAGERVLTIWEVPVLEAGWARRLEWRARRTGPVIALAGFRGSRGRDPRREAGAVACLELPCDLDDLIDAVDRVVGATPPDSWPIPARAEPPHVLPPRVATPVATAAWSPRRRGRIGGRRLQYP